MEGIDYSVKYLQDIKFDRLSFSEKVEIKRRGRLTPPLSLEQASSSNGRSYTRQFNIAMYDKHEWLCGCQHYNALFCFPCLLFGGDHSWTIKGVTDLKHLNEKILKHEKSSKHICNVVDLSLLGKVNIAAEIDSGYKLAIEKHNSQVKKNSNFV